jgi:hypothetical protein
VASVAGSLAEIYPIRGTFFDCCAGADEQSAKSMAQRAKQKILLLIRSSPLLLLTFDL